MAEIWLAIPDAEKEERFQVQLAVLLPGHELVFHSAVSAMPRDHSPDAIVLDLGGLYANYGDPHFTRMHTDYALAKHPSATLLVTSAMGSYMAQVVADMRDEGLPVLQVAHSVDGIVHGLIRAGVVDAPDGWVEAAAEAASWGMLTVPGEDAAYAEWQARAEAGGE